MNHISLKVQEKSAFEANYSCFSIFSSCGHFVHWCRTVLAILAEGHLAIFLLSLNEIGTGVWEELAFKDFSIFSSGGHLVYLSETILAILVGSHLGNIPVKFELYWSKGSGVVSF